MLITGLSIRNLGDGRFVELNWSTVDPFNVKHFILQRWERHKKQWVPYDNFHGIVPRQITELDENPPQRLIVEIDDYSPSQQSFRVQAIGHDGTATEWVTGSVEFSGQSFREGDEQIWFVDEGLIVGQVGQRSLEIQPGSAVCAGVVRVLDAPLRLELPPDASNAVFIVWINQDGLIDLGTQLPFPAMRLAHVVISPAGHIQEIEDVRFLWAPDNFSVDWRLEREGLAANVLWQPFWEVNLKGWVLQKAAGEEPSELDFQTIETLPDHSAAFTDRRVQDGTAYHYRIAAVDWNDRLSPWSPIQSILPTTTVRPAPPTGLTGTLGGDANLLFHHLRWDPHPDESVELFHIYRELTVGEATYWVHLASTSTNEYLRSPVLERDITHRYYVTAANAQGIESLPSDTLSLSPGKITVPPKAPVWRQKAYETANHPEDDELAIAYFFWQPVTEKTDASLADDLELYELWRVETNEENEKQYFLEATTQPGITQAESRTLTQGVEYTFALSALDQWGNRSAYSSEITFTAGDDRIPLAPVLLRADNLSEPTPKVILEWTPPTEDTKSRPLTNLAAIEIWRGTSSVLLEKIHEVGAEATSWIDAGVDRSIEYSYYLIARTQSGNRSEPSNLLQVLAGDIPNPPPPLWADVDPLTTRVDEAHEITNTLRFTLDSDPTGGAIRGVYILHGTSLGSQHEIAFVPNDGSAEFVFEHAGRTNGQRDYYCLIAQAESGRRSAPSNVLWIDAGDSTPPAAPVVTTSPLWQQGQAGISLSWEAQEGIVRYEIYRSTVGPDLRFTLYDTVLAPLQYPFTIVFEDLDLINGKQYYYRVVAVNALGVASEPAAVDEIAGDTTPPESPQVQFSLEFDPAKPHVAAVTLSWPAVPDAENYRIFSSVDGFSFTLLAETSASHFQDERPYASKVTYRVQALDEAGNPSLPDEVTVSFINENPPGPITDLSVSFSASVSGRLNAEVTWDYVPAPGFARFLVFVAEDQEPLEFAASIEDPDRHTITIPELTSGLSYHFAVRVEDVWGNLSTLVSHVDLAEDTRLPAVPANLSATPRPGAVEVRWDPVFLKEDGAPLLNFKTYRIQASQLSDFSILGLDVTAPSPGYLHHTSKDNSWYYRVQAIDTQDQASEWSDPVGPVSSLEVIADNVGDTTPPEAPEWADPAWQSSMSGSSAVPRQRYALIELFWEPIPDVYQYFVYRKEGGQSYRIGTSRLPYFRWDGALPGNDYTFFITASFLNSEESDPSPDLTITAAHDDHVPAAPEPIEIIQGLGVLAPRWRAGHDQDDQPIDLDLDRFEVEYRTTVAPPATPDRPWSEWIPIPDVGLANYYLHVSLEYETYYAYRVRAINMGGFASDWAYFEPQDGLQPNQGTSADLAVGTVLAIHLAAESVEGKHVKFRTLEGQHLQVESIDSEHFKSKIVKTEHLDVSLGGSNQVKNSAFGQRGLDGDLGVDWELTAEADIVEDPFSPIGEYALHLVDGASATQSFKARAGESVFSFYLRLEDVDSEGLTLRLLTDDQAQDEVWSESFEGSMGYTLIERSLDLSVEDLVLAIEFEGDGEAWLTGLQLEPGNILTPWRPKAGEVYGAEGSVQINSDGIRIIDGKLRIVTGQNQVVLDHEGLLATHGQDRFSKLDHQGLTLAGGSFVITTGDPEEPGDSVVFDSQGLRAYSQGSQTVDLATSGHLSVYDGSFTFTTAPEGATPPARMNLDATGLRAYSGGQETVSLDASEGSFTLRQGKFSIFTGTSALSNSSLTLDQSGLRSLDAAGATTFWLKSSGSLELTKSFLLRSQESGARIEMDAQGLRGYDGFSVEPRYEIKSDGTALFRNGSLTIIAANEAIVLDSEGLAAYSSSQIEPIFALTAQGLVIDKAATITLGDVTINDDGIAIRGSQGLVVQSAGPAPEDLLRIDAQGIALLAGNSLRIQDDGRIVFYPDPTDPSEQKTAIDRFGIQASAITTGALTISPQAGSPYIRVLDEEDNERIVIDAQGIVIEDGAFTLRGPNGQTVIQNGEIQTDALSIGLGGSNRIRNGRADFETSFWTYDAGLQVSVETTIVENPVLASAGVSGPRGFRLQGSDEQTFAQEMSGYFFGPYTASAWVYVHQGKLALRIVGGEFDNKPAEVTTQKVQDGWERIVLRFYAQGFLNWGDASGLILEIETIGTTLAYITDICVTEGYGESGYSPHAGEIEAQNGSLRISDEGVHIKNATLEIETADSSVRLDSLGLRGYEKINDTYHERFTLNQDGLAIQFAEQDLTINKDGVWAGNTTEYALLDKSGLKIRGGAFDIRSGGDSLIIDAQKIRAQKSSAQYVEISAAEGLKVTGGAGVVIETASSGERVRLDNEGLRFYVDNKSTPVIHLGYNGVHPGDPSRQFRGLFIDDGAIFLRGVLGNQEMMLTPGYIEIKDLQRQTASIWGSDRIEFYTPKDGGKSRPYLQHVEAGVEEVDVNTGRVDITFNAPFYEYENPQVIVAPSAFEIAGSGGSSMLDITHGFITSQGVVTGLSIQLRRLMPALWVPADPPTMPWRRSTGSWQTVVYGVARIGVQFLLRAAGFGLGSGGSAHAYIYTRPVGTSTWTHQMTRSVSSSGGGWGGGTFWFEKHVPYGNYEIRIAFDNYGPNTEAQVYLAGGWDYQDVGGPYPRNRVVYMVVS